MFCDAYKRFTDVEFIKETYKLKTRGRCVKWWSIYFITVDLQIYFIIPSNETTLTLAILSQFAIFYPTLGI